MSDAPEVMGPTGVIYVCGECGMPTETEPCAEHQPEAYAAMYAEPIQVPPLGRVRVPASGTFHLPIRVGPEGAEALRRTRASLEAFAAAMRPLADALRRSPVPRWRIYRREVNRPPSHAAENAKFGARQRHRRRRR